MYIRSLYVTACSYHRKKEGIEIKQISALGILFTFKTGEFVWPVLSENIINECLKRSVPTTSAQVMMMMTTIMIIMIVIILIIIRMCIMITMQCYLSFTY